MGVGSVVTLSDSETPSNGRGVPTVGGFEEVAQYPGELGRGDSADFAPGVGRLALELLDEAGHG